MLNLAETGQRGCLAARRSERPEYGERLGERSGRLLQPAHGGVHGAQVAQFVSQAVQVAEPAVQLQRLRRVLNRTPGAPGHQLQVGQASERRRSHLGPRGSVAYLQDPKIVVDRVGELAVPYAQLRERDMDQGLRAQLVLARRRV